MTETKRRTPTRERGTDADGHAVTPGRRLAPEARERQIVEKAIEHFATHGFSGSTRELARQIGVTQPLLYRYFPSKEALIDRVYDEIYTWNPDWEKLIADRTVPLQERLVAFYRAYAQTILRREWIRTFIFAGLSREGFNTRYLSRLRERVFLPVLRELRHEYALPTPTSEAQRNAEIELVWSLHASIFYFGVRKWVYGLPVPDDLDTEIERLIDAFLNGTPAALKQLASGSTARRRRRA
ncbi:bacterial regulatory s, tetR family protein [Burkholderia multivorans]|uniref:Bacterial regulatory s, tetR family protein n=1 Tax=Burkholderia multivorans TaxID=87883 RepID=A0ABD7LG94_9BURK|nr:TetR/AcrR family transcriptional regulator [Burkholderia multivorans]MBU9259538.1 TetR/AcrR family transcriptional regulator [Burkholderia multivorans]SAK02289.1 bacterial regulatory s, tetR family protein [Burkholderia multivorans]SAK03530.1 bacterial regulatory s, tetR family protein [Burkholderia multivorans]HEF5153441.1 TetR/AcrR family transcriptional regulator [Burkholderia multivorans]